VASPVPPPQDAFQLLLERSHLARVEDLPAMLLEAAGLLDVVELVAYVVDYGQRVLVPLVKPGSAREPLPIDSSLAGWSYRDVVVRQGAQADPRAGDELAPEGEAPWRVWLPVVDGTERLGVLEVVLNAQPDDDVVHVLMRLAALVAELLVARSAYGDATELARRRLPMSVAAELQWSLLPPLTYASPEVVLSGVMEPCYDIGGDSFDYAMNGHKLHVAVFDAMGHGIGAAQLATLAVAAYRNARRSGLDLVDTVKSVDRWVSSQFHEQFVTGIIAELDCRTGLYRKVNAGHPPGLLFRNGRHVKTLPAPTAFPLGLAGPDDPEVAEEALEPGDRILLYTDGLIEARSADGEQFGVARLADFLARQLAAELPAPETMRRLMHTILDYQAEELQDDATAVLLEWSGDAARRTVP
jgi:serine phosphatase RsbU (regulator of sigma subunit)